MVVFSKISKVGCKNRADSESAKSYPEVARRRVTRQYIKEVASNLPVESMLDTGQTRYNTR
jgi:hypothetical protein